MNYLSLIYSLISNIFKLKLKRKIIYLLCIPTYISDFSKLRSQINDKSNAFPFGKFKPNLNDRSSQGGIAKGHYFHQDLLVAQSIFKNKPATHVDIGSRIDGFCAHVASFMEVEVWDIRPIESSVHNIKFRQFDVMDKDKITDGICESLSCLHTVEHFGLGRYGDNIAIDGHLTGFENLCRMVQTGGKFYFSVPIGKQRIEFNAHRIFSISYLLQMFEDNGMRVDRFSYVNDKGYLFQDAEMSKENISQNFSCRYGCGIFELTKVEKLR